MPHLFKSFVAFGLFAAVGLIKARTGEPVVPEFWFAEPASELAAAAVRADIATESLAAEPSRSVLAKGDSVTALVEHVDGAKRRQWLVLLAGSELSDKDRALPATPGLRLFTSTGNEHVYAGSRAAIAIHVVGPVNALAAGKKHDAREPKDIWSGALVNDDFLQLGFAQASSTWLRLRDVRAALGDTRVVLGLSARGTPFPPVDIEPERAAAESMGVTAEDERAMFGVVPALLEFFGVAARTPGLNDILVTVVDIPMWSIIARGGKVPDISFENIPITARVDPRPWGIPESVEAYEAAFLLHLNNRPALAFRITAVPARPPLIASAGIVGLVAGRPDGKGPRLMIRIVASRLGKVTAPDAPEVGEKIESRPE